MRERGAWAGAGNGRVRDALSKLHEAARDRDRQVATAPGYLRNATPELGCAARQNANKQQTVQPCRKGAWLYLPQVTQDDTPPGPILKARFLYIEKSVGREQGVIGKIRPRRPLSENEDVTFGMRIDHPWCGVNEL